MKTKSVLIIAVTSFLSINTVYALDLPAWQDCPNRSDCHQRTLGDQYAIGEQVLDIVSGVEQYQYDSRLFSTSANLVLRNDFSFQTAYGPRVLFLAGTPITIYQNGAFSGENAGTITLPLPGGTLTFGKFSGNQVYFFASGHFMDASLYDTEDDHNQHYQIQGQDALVNIDFQLYDDGSLKHARVYNDITITDSDGARYLVTGKLCEGRLVTMSPQGALDFTYNEACPFIKQRHPTDIEN